MPVNLLLEAALQYASRGWWVIPTRGMHDGRCTCGQPCGDKAGKHAYTRKNQDGTWGLRDPAAIERHWDRNPHDNVALATGRGLVVIDIDNADQRELYRELWAQHGGEPSTLMASTGRGAHVYLEGTLESSRHLEDLLVRGGNSYVIAPPSIHQTGKQYQWVNRSPLTQFPNWLKELVESYENEQVTDEAFSSLLAAPFPIYLGQIEQDQRGSALYNRALRLDIPQQTPELMADIGSALAAVPASCNRDTWYKIGMALKSLGWERSDGTSICYDYWNDWSSTCPAKYAEWDCATVWRSFRDDRRGPTIGIGRLFFYAKQYGWRRPFGGVKDAAALDINGHASVTALLGPAPVQAIRFVDLDDDKNPRGTCTNAGIAIEGLGVSCRKDVFHEKMLVGGHSIQQWAGDLSDDAVHMLRKLIKRKWGFDPGERNTRDAAIQLCLEHQFNPVVDYLDGLAWDCTPRLDRWLCDYLGAPDTRLVRAIGRLMLVAAVRRAREPGTKFDQIVVLEGREGTGKSTALKILAGEENFSDQHLIGASDKEQQEAVTGVWVHEIAELAGMRRTDVERVKAFASRTEDRARPAYGRVRVDMKRRGIFVATTNADTYLMSETGNRRFWPVRTGRIDLTGLARDRNQLWAEASKLESSDENLALPASLWVDMAELQSARLEDDPWEDAISKYVSDHGFDVSITDVLKNAVLLSLHEIRQVEQNRAVRIVKKLGMHRYRDREGAARPWKYRKLLGPPGPSGDS